MTTVRAGSAPADRRTPAGPPGPSAARELIVVLLAALAAGVAGFVAAAAGTKVLFGLVGAIVAGLAVWSVRDLVGPPLAEAVDRVRPRPVVVSRPPRPVAVRFLVFAGVTLGSGIGGWFLAQQGTKALLGFAGLLVGAVALWLAWPLAADLVRTEPTDVAPRPPRGRTPGGGVGSPAVADRSTTDAPGTTGAGSRVGRAAAFAFAVGAATVFAWGAAQLGLKGLIALVGGIAVAACFVYVRDRSVFFTFAAVCSLAFVLHKSFTATDATSSGGAPSIYISTFDAMVLLLYAVWIAEGSFGADVRAALRRRILWLPLVGALFLLPSLLGTENVVRGLGELTRMGWMYLLFFYVAVRVRTRRHVWAVLGGLSVLALVECVVVVLQWRTGGVLGLSFLGVPTQLGERVTDSSVIGRPFGTIIHPVFMGATMASLGLLALTFALTLPRSLTRLAALVLVPVCVLPLYLAHTRASLVAFAMIALVLVGIALHRGRITWATIGRLALAGLALLVVFWPQVSAQFGDNFATGHFTEEIDSRHELNDLAGRMIADHPVIGVGLNDFVGRMAPYEQYGIIFFGNPVHNLYLLVLAETGVIGLIGVLLVGVGLYDVAIRLARSPDRLLGGVGLGVAAVMAFLMVEELLGFSLRQDIPLALYWLLAGLAVACSHQAGFDGDRAASSWSRLRPRHGPRPGDGPTPDEGGAPGDDRRIVELEASLARRAAARPGGSVPRAVDEASLPLDELVTFVLAAPATRADRRAAKRLDAGPGRGGRPPRGGRRLPAGRPPWRWGTRPRVAVIAGALVALAAMGALLPAGGSSGAAGSAGVRIVFSGTERATGVQGVFLAAADGSDIRRITPADGRYYNWPQWAFGGTRIVLTVRTGAEGAPEDLYLLDPASGALQLVEHFEYRIGQPKVTPDGRSVVFTAQTPWFPTVALFRLDLDTLEAVNLSAVTRPRGTLDADPMPFPGGDRIAFASSQGDRTDIESMAADGTDRRALTDDDHFNTDPDVSPDGRRFAAASYRGEGNPGEPGRISLIGVKPEHWQLVVGGVDGGVDAVLTEGQNCTERPLDDPCTPAETSAFKPRWSPDGNEIGFNAALDGLHTCICAIRPDGTGGRVVVGSADIAIDWFDWALPGGVPAGAVTAPGAQARSSRVLLTYADGQRGVTELLSATPDLMHREVLSLPDGLVPEQARWSADRRRVVFTADADVDPSRPLAPYPAPPPGATRREHVTLEALEPTGAAHELADPLPTARRQVFLREVDGSVRQLTTPWIEDWRDGVRAGDLRSNTDPALSPDGRYVVFTNTSTLTDESFLLRLDLVTGEVLNLTNGTSGAEAVTDAQPTFSPDGRRVAFVWTRHGVADVYLADLDGTSLRALTDDDDLDVWPAWTPDGASVVFASRRADAPAPADGEFPRDGWRLVRVAADGGARTVLTAEADSPTWQPVAGPEGDRLLYLGTGGGTGEVFVVPATGGTPRPLQPSPLDNELSVDWR